MSDHDAQEGANPSVSTPRPVPTPDPAATATVAIINDNNVNVTVVMPPTPRAAAPRSRPRSAEPPSRAPRATSGFALDAYTVNVEGQQAEQNDTRQDNVTTRIAAQESSYKVGEETRRRSEYNTSLQSVGAYADSAQPVNTRAFVISTNGASKTTLEGYANGTVMLIEERNGIKIRTDITGANREITAAGIRMLERNIAADGEVDRVEQQQIINLVDKARLAAAARH